MVVPFFVTIIQRITAYTVCPTDLGPTLEIILGMLLVMNIAARIKS